MIQIGNLNFIILLAVFCILLTMKKPFLGIIFIVIMHFWFGSIEAGMYPRILSVIFVGLVLTPVLAIERRIGYEKVEIDTKTQRILGISITIFLWEVFVNQFIHAQSFTVFIRTTAKVFIPILLSFLIYVVIQTKDQFNEYIFILVLLISVSALMGILQYLGISGAWKLREMQGPILHRSEPAGLALFVLHLSYQLGFTLPLVFSIIMRRNLLHKKNIFYVLAFISMAIGLILTTVRSAISGALIGLIITLVIIKKFKKGLILLLILTVFMLLLFSYMDTSRSRRLTSITDISDSSAATRVPLFLTGIKVAKDNLLFGVGSGRFQEQTEDYYRDVFHMRGAPIIFSTTPHNQFINTLVYFGIPALLLLLYFYFKLIKGLFKTQKTTHDNYYRYISAGLIGSFISYIINSFFHNAGPFISDPYNWFFIGAALVLFKFQNKGKT